MTAARKRLTQEERFQPRNYLAIVTTENKKILIVSDHSSENTKNLKQFEDLGIDVQVINRLSIANAQLHASQFDWKKLLDNKLEVMSWFLENSKFQWTRSGWRNYQISKQNN